MENLIEIEIEIETSQHGPPHLHLCLHPLTMGETYTCILLWGTRRRWGPLATTP
jgi:hypothetical protein